MQTRNFICFCTLCFVYAHKQNSRLCDMNPTYKAGSNEACADIDETRLNNAYAEIDITDNNLRRDISNLRSFSAALNGNNMDASLNEDQPSLNRKKK